MFIKATGIGVNMFENSFRDNWKEYGWRSACYDKYRDITRPFRRFWAYLKKLKAYEKTLRDVPDWDYVGVLKVMRLQLERLHDVVRDGRNLLADRRAKEIKICITLIDRILAHNYGEHLLAKIDAEFGELEFNSAPWNGDKSMRRMILDRKFAREGTKTFEEVHKRSRKLYSWQEEQRQRDIDDLFDRMKEIQMWWD